MTAPDRGATYQIALASTGSSTHDAASLRCYAMPSGIATAAVVHLAVALNAGLAPRRELGHPGARKLLMILLGASVQDCILRRHGVQRLAARACNPIPFGSPGYKGLRGQQARAIAVSGQPSVCLLASGRSVFAAQDNPAMARSLRTSLASLAARS